jgi:divinyl protochlorophyllide a 8-vinyl-reductase
MTPTLSHPARPAGKIGPNGVTRLAEALRAVEGDHMVRRVFSGVGLAAHIDTPPEEMVDERDAETLHAALRATLGEKRARTIGWIAGQRTADYLISARIPRPVQWLMKVAPPPLASRLLTSAMASHAWTFAGSGTFRARHGHRTVLSIENCPMCRGHQAAEPLCDFYAGAFERLYGRLVHPAARVTETHCQSRGDLACRFSVNWHR